MRKILKVFLLAILGLWLVSILISPFAIYLPWIWTGRLAFARSGEPFLEAHERAINTFVDSKGFGFSRIRSAQLWNEQSIEFEGQMYEPEHIRLIGLTSEHGPRYFDESMPPEKESLKKTNWRPLSEWETQAVEKLKHGAPYVSQKGPDKETEIRVSAPMFAEKSCLKCHDTLEGELIGALDYWLLIWPPRDRPQPPSQ